MSMIEIGGLAGSLSSGYITDKMIEKVLHLLLVSSFTLHDQLKSLGACCHLFKHYKVYCHIRQKTLYC